jgi:hypothetical protein
VSVVVGRRSRIGRETAAESAVVFTVACMGRLLVGGAGVRTF